ncbi:MAG: tetratricopeptide repeat protein [Methyloprofundus sp.]|nr:tetratricopeptide repeat protein [Methyloprofundus sp.]
MKQIFAIFLFVAANLMPALVKADEIGLTVQKIESEWARIYYSIAQEQRDAAFKQLLIKLKTLQTQYPNQAELIIRQAIIVASNAVNIGPFSALQAIHQARDLLLRAIELDPGASDGAAFVTLGSLYYQVPGWPLAYGDNDKARAMLEKALAINPNTIDANYFYADLLVTLGEPEAAMIYFKRALAVPVRASQVFADTQLQQQVKSAIIANSHDLATHRQIFSLAYGAK